MLRLFMTIGRIIENKAIDITEAESRELYLHFSEYIFVGEIIWFSWRRGEQRLIGKSPSANRRTSTKHCTAPPS